jgi:hypothetical protein
MAETEKAMALMEVGVPLHTAEVKKAPAGLVMGREAA